jgi:hypothetical protein
MSEASEIGKTYIANKIHNLEKAIMEALQNGDNLLAKRLENFIHTIDPRYSGNWTGENYSARKHTPDNYLFTAEDKQVPAASERDQGSKRHDIGIDKLVEKLKSDLTNPDGSTWGAYRDYHNGYAKVNREFNEFQAKAKDENLLTDSQIKYVGMPLFERQAKRHKNLANRFKNNDQFNSYLQNQSMNALPNDELGKVLMDPPDVIKFPDTATEGLGTPELSPFHASQSPSPPIPPGTRNIRIQEWSDGGDEGMSNLQNQFGSDNADWGMPVVLDLNNDGNINIIPISQSSARFDIAGTGRRQVLAWVGPEDGLLVYDRDGDRLISHKDEIAFKDYLATAKTDLEGLAWFDQLAQGGNEDGVLDEQDAAWSKFGVWRDANLDGATDEGELRMTGEGGLASVNLTSDQRSRDAGPDSRIHGKGSYEYLDSDGIVQTADLYDTSLRYEHPEATGSAFPKLVRRDGQQLTIGEIIYPAMDYENHTYELWPTSAIERANKLYPGMAHLANRQVNQHLNQR